MDEAPIDEPTTGRRAMTTPPAADEPATGNPTTASEPAAAGSTLCRPILPRPAPRRLRLAVVIGTRPEAIKLAPVILAARERPAQFEVRVIRTGQHRELVDSLMDEFGLHADVDLDLMQHDQGLAYVMAASVRGLSEVFARDRPDWVLVQGDTTTTFAGALAAFYHRVRVGHIEAGLRTGDLRAPFPEEANRLLTARLADLHFAPTEQARRHLLREGIDEATVVVTGNTVIDMLRHTLKAAASVSTPAPATTSTTASASTPAAAAVWMSAAVAAAAPPSSAAVATSTATAWIAPAGNGADAVVGRGAARYLLVTAHRRENHGAALGRICDALLALLERHPDIGVRVPMHPSPGVRRTIVERLGGHARVHLSEPLGYNAFVAALDGAALVLTDSGGVQEECAALGKPVLVLRDDTERPEAVDAGVAVLVGSDPRRIVEQASRLLDGTETRDGARRPTDAFGDGSASARILDALLNARRAAPSRSTLPLKEAPDVDL